MPSAPPTTAACFFSLCFSLTQISSECNIQKLYTPGVIVRSRSLSLDFGGALSYDGINFNPGSLSSCRACRQPKYRRARHFHYRGSLPLCCLFTTTLVQPPTKRNKRTKGCITLRVSPYNLRKPFVIHTVHRRRCHGPASTEQPKKASLTF